MKKNARINILLWLLLVLTVSFAVQAQDCIPGIPCDIPRYNSNKASLNVRRYALDSNLMKREMLYNLLLPLGYGSETNKSKRYAVIYLLHGLTGHYDNWTNKTKLSEYAAKYNYIIVTPEGDNGWYSDSATVPNDKYESYIIQELIPEIDKNFRTVAGKNHRAVAGLSMGGYGAVKFGLKYAEMFSLVGSFSGALGATLLNEKNAGTLGKSIDAVFGGETSETRNANDIFKIVREISDEKKKKLPFIYFDCGTEDFLIRNNRDFAALLFEKQISHEFRQLPGKHDWNFWDAQVQEFLELSEKYVK